MGIWKSENISAADNLSQVQVTDLTDGGVTTLHKHDIVTDTSPQLGADLDLNGNDITRDGISVITRPAISGDAQAIHMTEATSGSNGIQVANNSDINFGTGDFSLVWVGSLPDSDLGYYQYLIRKRQESAIIVELAISNTGLISVLLNGAYSLSSTAIETQEDAVTMIACVINQTSGEIQTYINGSLFEDLISFIPSDYSNSGILTIAGTTVARTASTIKAAYLYNRALSADDVASLYKYGVAVEDRGASMTPVYESDFSSDLSNWNDVISLDGEPSSDDEKLVLTYLDGSGGGVTSNHSGGLLSKYTEYSMRFKSELISGSKEMMIHGRSGSLLSDYYFTAGVETSHYFEFNTGNNTNIYIRDDNDNSAAIVKIWDIVIKRIGCTLALEPESIQPAPGQWLDTSGNNHHAKMPIEGCTLMRPQREGLIEWTSTWSASSAGAYIGGINEEILPEEDIRIEWIRVETETTGVDITIGDQTDTDRYVEATALANEIDISSPAERNHDGTNRKMVITPSSTYTGSIKTTIKYTLV